MIFHDYKIIEIKENITKVLLLSLKKIVLKGNGKKR